MATKRKAANRKAVVTRTSINNVNKDIAKLQTAIQTEKDPAKKQQLMDQFNQVKETINSFSLNDQEGTIQNRGTTKTATTGAKKR